MTVQEQMQERVSHGLSPITGRPMRHTGAVSVASDGNCYDEAGVQMTLDADGDWIPVEEAT